MTTDQRAAMSPNARGRLVAKERRSLPPYKVTSDGYGEADILDRATGKRVGYLRLWRNGWSGYLDGAAGVALIFEWVNRADERIGENVETFGSLLGWRWVPVTQTKYRKDAAERVWIAHTEGR